MARDGGFSLSKVHGFSALHELEYLFRAGLTPYEALARAIATAAR
jgi:hypothetical protein